jgi:hypothetical protein
VRPSLASAISRSVSSIAVETSTAMTCSGGTDVDVEEIARGWKCAASRSTARAS